MIGAATFRKRHLATIRLDIWDEVSNLAMVWRSSLRVLWSLGPLTSKMCSPWSAVELIKLNEVVA